jgi:hypothetical protein
MTGHAHQTLASPMPQLGTILIPLWQIIRVGLGEVNKIVLRGKSLSFDPLLDRSGSSIAVWHRSARRATDGYIESCPEGRGPFTPSREYPFSLISLRGIVCGRISGTLRPVVLGVSTDDRFWPALSVGEGILHDAHRRVIMHSGVLD